MSCLLIPISVATNPETITDILNIRAQSCQADAPWELTFQWSNRISSITNHNKLSCTMGPPPETVWVQGKKKVVISISDTISILSTLVLVAGVK